MYKNKVFFLREYKNKVILKLLELQNYGGLRYYTKLLSIVFMVGFICVKCFCVLDMTHAQYMP